MNIKKILILAIFAIAIVGIIAPASAAIESANKDKVYSIESKEKSAANKITWNANGGTIGSKKTISANVKKGSKIGKLPATPKRSGYTFSGWYTKKTGGSKIGVNTKPSKSITYYAQWKKQQTKTLNANEKALVGKYRFSSEFSSDVDSPVLNFKADGTFEYTRIDTIEKANWAVTSKGKISITNYRGSNYRNIDTNWYYMFDKVNGKSGIRYSAISLNNIKNSEFLEKM